MAALQFMSIIRATKVPKDFVIMPVVDVSGSMTGIPMEAGIALGLIVAYAQPESSPYSRMVMTFDSFPAIYKLRPIFGPDKVDVREVVKAVRNVPAGLSTDFNRCMDMMLHNLLRRKANPGDNECQPLLVVFTDMEFDYADGAGVYQTNLSRMECKYAEAGIPMPIIVFWNLRSSSPTTAAETSKKNVVMLSGFSAQLMQDFFEMLESGQFRDLHAEGQDSEEDEGEKTDLNTDNFIKAVLESEMYRRYKDVLITP
jgi:hypothetical protein